MTKPVLYEKFDGDNVVHQVIADQIHEWQDDLVEREMEKARITGGLFPSMLPLDRKKMAAHKAGILVFEAEDKGSVETFRSYNSVRDSYDNELAIEIGGLIVNPAFEGQGWSWAVKPEIYRQVEARWLGWNILIFANEKSLGMNESMGFKVINAREELPQLALDACGPCGGLDSCPNKREYKVQEDECCDIQIQLIADIDNLRTARAKAEEKMAGYGLVQVNNL